MCNFLEENPVHKRLIGVIKKIINTITQPEKGCVKTNLNNK